MERPKSMLCKGLLLTDPEHPPQPGWIRVEGGRIAEIGRGHTDEKAEVGGAEVILCPAFIDAHIHLPQIDSVGCDGLELLPWLEQVVFPAEAWWGAGAAASMTRTAVQRMVREGTFGFAGYLTSHAQAGAMALGMLASGVDGARLRFAAGRVAMDRNAPAALIDEDIARARMNPTPGVALSGDGLGDRGEVSVNPRFAIACTDELLAECGWLVRKRAESGRPIVMQTHLSESVPECRWIGELFPGDRDYTSVYDRAGLLTERSVLAHAVHLSDAEFELIAQRRAVLAHCPIANTFLESGLFDLDRAREHGVRVALGSDVAAGVDIAMPRVARAMIEIAKIRKMTISPGADVPKPSEAWSMITRGNADALGWSDSGRLEVGAHADILALRVPETWRDGFLIGRLLYNWTSDLIVDRVVAGARVARVDGVS
ncbi:MAG: amidohydrolase family protein [Phycisphaeraceae bacterium]|nr:amidohydrolase family protein [Phycisphaeraceae bacterium]MCB9848125.1 amidohydrolase family protein [Phycisphaeraceae bacterium]